MRAPLDADRLLVLVTVLREGSFSRAARALGRTQPAVSAAIGKLEDELGAPLFVRDGRRVRPTAAAAIAAEHAERALAEMDRARARVAAVGDVREGRLAIGASDTLACHVLPPALAAMRRRHPGVELRLENRTSPVVAERVADRALDAGIVTTPLPARLAGTRGASARIEIEPLVPWEEVVVCRRDHPLARRRSTTLAALARFPLVLLSAESASRSALDAALAAAGARAEIAMESSSVEVLARLVQLGFGASVLPRVAVARAVRERALAAVRLDGYGEDRRVALVLPAGGAASVAALAFAAIVRETIGAAARGRSGVAAGRAVR